MADHPLDPRDYEPFGDQAFMPTKDTYGDASSVTKTPTVIETSTTWLHGNCKVFMKIIETGGSKTRLVKAIDMTPNLGTHQKINGGTVFEGSLEEFLKHVGSLHLLASLAKEASEAKAKETSEAKTNETPP